MLFGKSDLFCESFGISAPVRAENSHTEVIYGTEVLFGRLAEGEGESGAYATAVCPRLWEREELMDLTLCAAHLLKSIGEAAPERVLVCALGNEKLTVDALGALTLDRVLCGKIGSRRVYTVKAGVPAASGIPTAEVIAMYKEHTGAGMVICVDSLAAVTPERLGGVLQVTDRGISPGSAVSSHADTVNREVLGVPVLTLGIPTVIRGEGGVLYTCALADELVKRGAAVIAGAISSYLSG